MGGILMKFQPKGKTKVRLLSLILAVAMLFSAVPMAAATDAPDVSVAVFTDINYMTPAEQGSGSEAFSAFARNKDTLFRYMEGIIDAALASVKDKALNGELDYLIVNGSLTATGSEASHLALADKLLQLEADTDGALQVIVINGQGDVNASAFSFENGDKESVSGITHARFKEIYADLGYDLADDTYAAGAGKAGGLSYAVKLPEGIRLIMADTARYTSDVTEFGNTRAEDGGIITDGLLNWIKAQAAQAKTDGYSPVLVSDFGLVPMNRVVESMHSAELIKNYYKLSETLADGGIHFHIGGKVNYNDISSVISDEGEILYGIMSSALTSFPTTYRLIGLTKGTGAVLKADFSLVDCDDVTPVVYGGENMSSPFRTEHALNASFGAVASSYVEKFMLNLADDFLDKVKKAGGFVKYYEEVEGISIQYMVDSLFFGGISIDGTPVLSGQNVISFLNAIDQQLMSRYVNNRSYTYTLVKAAAKKIAALPASSYPSTKFYAEYGMGDPNKAGTFGDALVSTMLYMTLGNEDSSEDEFINDVINNLYDGTLANDIFNIVFEVLFDDILVNDLLANTRIDITSYFLGEAREIASYIQVAFDLIMDLIYKGNSYKTFFEIVLENTDTKYGKSFADVKKYLKSSAITDDDIEAMGLSAAELLVAATNDENPTALGDYDVSYTYSGKVDVNPTRADFRLPSMKTAVFGANTTSSVNISWYTKLSVTGTDIEIYPAASGGAMPVFKGQPTTGSNIRTVTKVTKLSFPAGDFGIFNLGTTQIEALRHVIQLTGLQKGKTYFYRVGDAAKGWWSEIGSFTTAKGGSENFTFLYMSESGGKTKAQYQIYKNTLVQALNAYPQTSFIMHAGSMTANGASTTQWQWALDGPAEELSRTILMPTAGRQDGKGINSMINTFNLAVPEIFQEKSSLGLYYSFDYNSVHFAVLNTNDQNSDGTISEAQIKWLKEDLENSTAPWKIVVMNKSPYSSGEHIGDPETIALRKQITDLMYKYRVDLILQGNDGVYMRSQPIRAGLNAGSDANTVKNSAGRMYVSVLNPLGPIYLNSGPAGALGSTTVPDSETVKYIPRGAKSVDGTAPMFSAITVEGDNLFLDAYAVDGDTLNVIERIAIERGKKQFLLGDVDFDDKVTASDAREILRHAAIIHIITGTRATMAADINGDGKINASDARLVLRKVAKIEDFKNPYIYVPNKELWK